MMMHMKVRFVCVLGRQHKGEKRKKKHEKKEKKKRML
jgi:hypothetical protein